MNMNKFVSWIDYEFKSYYLDSSKRGLRIIKDKNINLRKANFICEYLKFLRKRYFFPLRCYIHLTAGNKYKSANNKYCYGIFFPGDEKKKTFPSIYLPIGSEDTFYNNLDDIFQLTKLLTYYYQWYFLQDKKRSNRSLEIEATKMASRLVEEFEEYINDKMDEKIKCV